MKKTRQEPEIHSVRQSRQIVNDTVDEYCKLVTQSAVGSDYLARLQANTERLQGSLVLLGYEMLGGRDEKMILRAALAIEMLHAYVQCMDKNVDITQAQRAAHEAEIILANLDTDPENRLKVVSITNRTMMLAAQARLGTTKPEDKLYWQATELTLNPLHVGQVLTGSNCDPNNAVTPFAINLGYALLEPDNKQTHLRVARESMEHIKPFTETETLQQFQDLISGE